jgi:ATP-dependent Clp protease ATP-binding subunit ClpC
LARGELQVIGATTLDEYRKNIEDGALTRRFQQVLVAETTIEETKHILMNIKDKYEKHQGLSIVMKRLMSVLGYLIVWMIKLCQIRLLMY